MKTIAGGILAGFIIGFVRAGGDKMLFLVLNSVLGYEVHMAVFAAVILAVNYLP